MVNFLLFPLAKKIHTKRIKVAGSLISALDRMWISYNIIQSLESLKMMFITKLYRNIICEGDFGWVRLE